MIFVLIILSIFDVCSRYFLGLSLHLSLWLVPFIYFLRSFKLINIQDLIFVLFYSALSPITFVKLIFISNLNYTFKYLSYVGKAYIFTAFLAIFLWGISGSKSFFGLTVYYSLGPEGDPNYSLASVGAILLFFYLKKSFSLYKVLFLFFLFFLVFWSRGIFLAFILSIFIIIYDSKKIGFFIITILLFFPFILVFIDKSTLMLLSQLSSYRTDVWLTILGYDPVLMSHHVAINKQAHNAVMQLYSEFGMLISFLYIFSILALYLKSKSFYPLIFYFSVVGFSLNSITSFYFIFSLIAFFSLNQVLRYERPSI